jgi:S1-C subfamily serine protease
MILSPSGAYSGVGFAVPVDIMNQVVPELILYGSIQRGVLGVGVLEDSIARRLGVRSGALIFRVGEGSGAEAAGIEPATMDEDGRVVLGDVIVEVGGRPIRVANDLSKSLDGHKAGERIPVVVERKGQRVTLTVELQAPAQN